MKRNYIPWNRNWVVIKRHLPIVLKPLIIALVSSIFWRYIIYPNKFHFSIDSREPIQLIVLPLVGFMYVIFASIAVTTVFNQYRTISNCVVKKDLDTFLLYRDEQLPIMMHILVGAPSLILMVFVLLYNYQMDTWIGLASVFSVAFMFVLVYVVSTELDDFSKSIWFKERIPINWYEINIEEYFNSNLHLKSNSKKVHN